MGLSVLIHFPDFNTPLFFKNQNKLIHSFHKSIILSSTPTRATPMKLLQIHTFYSNYLDDFYTRYPHLQHVPFAEQMAALVQDGFAAVHMLAPHLRRLGYNSQLVIANNLPSQLAWARENGLSNISQQHWLLEITRRQVEKIKPDILYLSDPITFDSRFVRALTWKPSLVLGWRAAAIPNGTDWTEFDLILSNHTPSRERALACGAKATEYFQPGFPEFLAEAVKSEVKLWDVVFAGGVYADHTQRLAYLKEVAKAPLGPKGDFSLAYFILSSPEVLPAGVSMYNQGARWGMEMYRPLKKARIALNIHIDLTQGEKGKEGGNMRMFETTGVGSFLLTDDMVNIRQYFEPGVELETFQSPPELIEKIHYYLEHPDAREAIARRGQARCLKEHSMSKRVMELNNIIQKYLSKSSASRNVSNADAAIQQALTHLNANQNQEALTLLNQVLQNQPELVTLYYGKAVALARLSRISEAVETVTQLLAKVPTHEKGKQLLMELQAYQALASSPLKSQSPPVSVPHLMQQAHQALTANDPTHALNLLSQAKALKQPAQNLDTLRAMCFLKLNQAGAAWQALLEELRYFPNNADAKNLLRQIDTQVPQLKTSQIQDPEFQELFNRVRSHTMLSEARLYSLFSLVKRICIENVPGNIVECGVAGGGSTALMALVIKRYTKQPRWLYAFDSFEGLPPPTQPDKHQGMPALATGWATGTCAGSEEHLRNLCVQLDIADLVKPVKGYFQDTLPNMRNWVGMIALLHLDGDWYESTKVILHHLYDRVVNNGFLQVDDYGYWEGCRQAIHEFETSRSLHFEINQIDDTGVWMVKPDQFPLNPVLPPQLINEFLQDDPVRLGLQSQMSQNERFQLYYALRKLLPTSAAAPLRFIEIGAFAGASLWLTCQALKRVTPHFQGFAIEPGNHPQLLEVLKHVRPYVTHLPMLSPQAVPQLQQQFARDGNFPLFIFVDGDHTYEGVWRDAMDYFQLLAPGGLMVFHDYLPPLSDENLEAILFHHGGKEPGVRQAFEELVECTYGEVVEIPLLSPTDPAQTMAYLPIIPGVVSTLRAYRKTE